MKIRSLVIGSFAAAMLVGSVAAQQAAEEVRSDGRSLGPLAPPLRVTEEVREIDRTSSLPAQDARQFAEGGGRLLRVSPRIVGGQPAPVGAYPWQVSLGLAGFPPIIGHFCGGALLSSSVVVTAAHCVEDISSAAELQVVSDTNFLNRGGTIHAVSSIEVHEDWDPLTFRNDIALLQLDSEASVTSIGPLSRSDAEELAADGVIGIVTGWGLTSEDGSVSNVLRQVGVQIVSNAVCNGPSSYSGEVSPEMLCAGFVEGGRDSCQGDSGGPLIVTNRQGGFLLAGVVSWGEGCARPNKFGVYTRVAEFSRWLNSRID